MDEATQYIFFIQLLEQLLHSRKVIFCKTFRIGLTIAIEPISSVYHSRSLKSRFSQSFTEFSICSSNERKVKAILL